MSCYCREDVLRILHLPVRQLVAWERAGLIAAAEAYSFDGLVQLRKLRDLVATRISVKSIVRSVDAMQKVSGMTNPLLESVAVRHGSRVAWRQYGALVDPVTRQMAFDFDLTASGGMAVVRRRGQESAPPIAGETQEMFLRAVRLEEIPGRLAEAKEVYETILELHPGHAAAAINLGTIRYNERDFAGAEQMYRAGDGVRPGVCAGVLRPGECAGRAAAAGRGDRRIRARAEAGAAVCGRALQPRAGLRTDEGATQGAAALDELYAARPDGAVVEPRAWPGQAHPRKRTAGDRDAARAHDDEDRRIGK